MTSPPHLLFWGCGCAGNVSIRSPCILRCFSKGSIITDLQWKMLRWCGGSCVIVDWTSTRYGAAKMPRKSSSIRVFRISLFSNIWDGFQKQTSLIRCVCLLYYYIYIYTYQQLPMGAAMVLKSWFLKGCHYGTR